jgi:ankyrin repeat protein
MTGAAGALGAGAPGATGATGAVRCTGAQVRCAGAQVRCTGAQVGSAAALALLTLMLAGSSTTLSAQATGRAAVAAAAQANDADAVRAQLKQGADANAAQGDGMTALHWAAHNGNASIASMLLYAGANPRATTRLGGYMPVHLAAQAGGAGVIEALAKAGAPIDAPTATGATALMLAARSGSVEAVRALLEGGANVNATESAQGQTALMFAAAADRAAVVSLLIEKGANATVATKIIDLAALTAAPGEEALQQSQQRQPQPGAPAGNSAPAAAPSTVSGARPAPAAAPARPTDLAGVTRPYRYNELIGRQGGLTALLFAARQGGLATAEALVAAGVDVNQVSPADLTSPLLMATINGHFDLAKYLLDRGADPNLASDAGATPLYAALNVQWAPKAFYPQPRAYLQQKLSYLELMTALLDKGADPNARLQRKIWYSSYNFDVLRVDEGGASAFWRAAYASDIDAMKMLVARGADPHMPTTKPAGRPTRGDAGQVVVIEDRSGLPPVPVGGPGVSPLQAAAGVGYGEGFAGNAHRFAPSGMLAAVKYLVEELGADVNAIDHDGNTALHHAAARGDVEMILYLVSKGADPTVINREGNSTADMANGPVQRTQPYPDARDLLVKLGAINQGKCVSC